MIRSRRLAAVALIAVAVTAGCKSSGAIAAGQAYPSAKPSTTRVPQNPSALLRSAMAAMLAKGSVHLSCTEYAGEDVNISSDLGVDSGSEIDTIVSYGNAKALLVDGVFYVDVSSKSILVSEGFPATVAATVAGDWISFQPGDSYGSITYPAQNSELMLEDVAERMLLTGTLKAGKPHELDGQLVVGISGDISASYGAAAKGSLETLYVRSTGDPLPVTMTQHISGVVETCDFSRWGKPLRLTAPPHAVPVTSLPSDGAST
jgi:hypothetical protein